MIRRGLISGVVVVAALAAAWWYASRSPVPPPPEPVRVEITEWAADGSLVVLPEIVDSRAVADLVSLFPGLEAGESDVVEQRQRTVVSIFYRNEPQPRKATVVEENDAEIWLRPKGSQPVDGSVHHLLTALPIMQAIQTIQMWPRESATKRNEAEKLLRENRDDYLSIMMGFARRQHQLPLWEGVRGLSFLVLNETYADWRYNCGSPSYVPRPRPTSRSPAEEPRVAEIRKWALDLLPAWGTGNADELCVLLAAVADQATINEVARRLADATNVNEMGVWLDCLQRCYGTPRLYEPSAICGNSSAEEYRAFEESQTKLATEARTTLLAWHDKHRNDRPDDQCRSVLQLWDAHLVPKQLSYGWEFEQTLRHFEFLLRRGPDFVPALTEVMAQTSDKRKLGGLEFVRAYLTGTAEAKVVTMLLEGTTAEKRLACDIIAAVGDPQWKDQLTNLIGLPVNGPDDGVLVQKAKETLEIVRRAEAILPQLKNQQDH